MDLTNAAKERVYFVPKLFEFLLLVVLELFELSPELLIKPTLA